MSELFICDKSNLWCKDKGCPHAIPHVWDVCKNGSCAICMCYNEDLDYIEARCIPIKKEGDE